MATISVISGTEAPQIDETGAEEYVFNVGTRKSKLALKQTEMVLAAATNAFPKCSFVVKARDTAAGDVDKVTPFKDMAVKNIWTHDLETLMIEGQLDLLVHALKGEFVARSAGSIAKDSQTYLHYCHRIVKLVAS